jgi:hypothetical protein
MVCKNIKTKEMNSECWIVERFKDWNFRNTPYTPGISYEYQSK